jgi:hypothetical protein
MTDDDRYLWHTSRAPLHREFWGRRMACVVVIALSIAVLAWVVWP